ncbi:RlpA-like double-psi beta-barrel-protein domain-containing protein-containing protein [Aspergillus aurantiobrunneus]
MKYQYLASIALAALSASTSVSAVPLKSEDNGYCQPGYSPSLYYITVTAEPTPTVEPTSSSPATSSTPVNDAHPTIGAIETIPAAAIKEPTTTESAAPPPSTLAAAETAPTQVAVVQPSTTTTTENPTASTTSSSSSTSTSTGTGTTTSGKATFYGGNVSGGTCSFTEYTIPSHLTGVAFSGEAWDNAAECGACVSVTGPSGNSIKAMIVDKCPECAPTHLDLFESAFSSLASPSRGIIPISYSFVPCAISSPLILKNKEGTSAYWFSMQVVNANEAVRSLEVSTDNGATWQGTTRSDYNFFENDAGFGMESVDVRITGVSGGVVVVKEVGVGSGESVTADENV